MDRKKSKWRRKPNIRLLVMAILLCIYTNLNSLESMPIIKMEYSPSNPKIQELFKLKFTIQTKDKSSFNPSSASSPTVLLNDDTEFLKFEQSKIYHDGKNIILEVQYRINKSGTLKLNNIFLIIGKNKILQPTIELYIENLEISKDTQFRVRLFDKKHNYINHNSTGTVFLGDEYLVVIEGNFKENSKDKVQVEYLPENNSLIEKNHRNIDWLNLNDGWHVISSFLWYSLNTGIIKLPKMVITITTEKENYTFELENEIVRVVEPETNESVFKKIEKEKLKQNLESSINISTKPKTELAEKLKIACNIKALRNRESMSFFYWQIKAEREALEQKLGLEYTFSVFNYKWYFLLLIFSVILILTLTLLLIIKKIRVNFFIVFLLSSGIAIALYAILTADFREEYTFQDTMTDNYIYLNPEEHSSQVDSIEIGETVKIIYTINGYKYIEKYNHVCGWIR